MDHNPSQSQTPHSPQDSLGRVPVDPLPAEFEAHLVELDALLLKHAQATNSVPVDLADRIYDATVGLIVPRELPLVAIQRRTVQATMWGRLAAAAAIAIAVSIPSAFTARHSTAQFEVAEAAPIDASDIERVLFEPTFSDSHRLDYLLDTREMTYEDLSTLIDRVEMEM